MISADYTPKNRLLAAFPESDLKEFFSDLSYVLLPQREILYDNGDEIKYVYFMEDGCASMLMTMENGASIEVGMVGFEGMIGIPLLFGATVSHQQVVVQLPGSALRLPAKACKTAFDQSAAVRKILLGFFDTMLSLSAQTAACNRLHSAEQRFARWLLLSSDRIQSNDLPLTQEYISAMLGIRRPGVTEIAGDLQRSALIQYRNGQIAIIDRSGLEDIACECYALDRERFDNLIR